MADDMTASGERPPAFEISPNQEISDYLWNRSLEKLDFQRKHTTLKDQLSELQYWVGMARGTLAVRPSSDGPIYTWVKGPEPDVRMIQSGSYMNYSLAIYVPNERMVETFMIAWGDCALAVWLRERAIRDEGEDAVARSRELMTVAKMEEVYGPMPTYQADRIPLPPEVLAEIARANAGL